MTTNTLGTASSYLGNIVLGVVTSPPAPPSPIAVIYAQSKAAVISAATH